MFFNSLKCLSFLTSYISSLWKSSAFVVHCVVSVDATKYSFLTSIGFFIPEAAFDTKKAWIGLESWAPITKAN